jgi:two-component system chemotaxis response regulator CheB
VDVAPAVQDGQALAAYDIVAVGTSAGGLTALSSILSSLPKDFPAPIVVVQHLDPRHPSHIADLLARRSSLAVVEAHEGDILAPGRVYIAPPDRHLLVTPDRHLSLGETELVHFVRPSADLLFRSTAAVFSERAVAVVLTGNGSDGSAGALAVKQAGGLVIAQDESSSDFFGMPSAAIEAGAVDLVLPLAEIAGTLISLIDGTQST